MERIIETPGRYIFTEDKTLRVTQVRPAMPPKMQTEDGTWWEAEAIEPDALVVPDRGRLMLSSATPSAPRGQYAGLSFEFRSI